MKSRSDLEDGSPLGAAALRALLRAARNPVAVTGCLLAVAGFSMCYLAAMAFGAQPASEIGAKLRYLGSERHFDLMAMVYMTGSEEDVARYKAARQTWLRPSRVLGLSFNYICLVCADDPGVWRLFGEDSVVVVPCEHGYSSLVTKGIEGYRYLAKQFTFNYVLKSDIDTIVPLDCVVRSILAVNRSECPSFGMGHWFPPRSSQVWTLSDLPLGPKYHNEEYLSDTGNEFYNAYPSGWAVIWSGDVARFLGMFGQEGAPQWRRSWRIDDAAIGTFLVGLDICQVGLPCHTASDVSAEDVADRSAAVSEDATELAVGAGGAIEGYRGPYDDDVAGPGDVANVQATSLGNCAARCKYLKRCVSFEYSPTAAWKSPIRNCQLASSSVRGGLKYSDFSLYVKT